jgi:hypothetical protein
MYVKVICDVARPRTGLLDVILNVISGIQKVQN